MVRDKEFGPEFNTFRGEGPWNPLLVARAVLRGLGMSGDDAKAALRPDQWEAWAYQRGED
ncbi:MAG TPA: hypothetical protein VFG22_16270 [Polyangiales bacterium]|nr:hypothetical protein [Polyangiales bacterium]